MLFNSTDEFSDYATLEERTFALLLKIDEIESNQSTNPNGLDYLTNFSVRYETPKTATGTIVIPVNFVEVSNSDRSEIRVVDVYEYGYSETGGGDQLCTNISAALYQAISAQYRAEKILNFNPAQVEYLEREFEDIEVGILGTNCLISFDFELPVITTGSKPKAAAYLQGNYSDIFA
ncbi:MAG: hypothetical protein F6K48_14245 [Okeania sp. SIO3H1]|uniref:hypothetical protein n=1 Tax=Okeania sp. SIO1I7 TaxID=2607772 RepID=UPI0013C63C75|nr:hypothetical protein [Okeania sp. SIO1I7]NEN90006.1 hypothetical protein [Okeania sp. SIO3H1]NET24979.1 hypothetical protein [Okeania sp. SIO1I7]